MNERKQHQRNNKSTTKHNFQNRKRIPLFDCSNNIKKMYDCNSCEYSTQYWVKYNEHVFGTRPRQETRREDKNYPSDGHTNMKQSAHMSVMCNITTLFCGPKFRYCCEECSEGFLKKEEVRAHKRRVHSLKTYTWLKCGQCSFQTLRTGSLEAHRFLKLCKSFQGIGSKWLECEKCPYKTKLNRCLDTYVLQNHIGRCKCKLCPYSTSDLTRLKIHQFQEHQIHNDLKWFYCDQCPYKAMVKVNLRNHKQRTHELDKTRWFLCDQCGLETQSKWRLKRHQREKHTADFVKHKCEYCSYIAKQRYHLTLHVTQKHTALEDVKWFECAHCSYKAKIKASLKNHLFKKHIPWKNSEK